MITAMVFDLDGTLVQTERLKAISYARAVKDLCQDSVSQDEVIQAFKAVVGRPRKEVALYLLETFNLEREAARQMSAFGVSTPWQAFVQMRLRHYEDMLSDPDTLQQSRWPHTLDILNQARETQCKTGLATMSRCKQARFVLETLGLIDQFDFVATRDDVERGKPDPEIYTLVSQELRTPPDNCLVLEDSPSGVQAALAAGMHCIAITTPFTKQGVHEAGLLAKRWIVDKPDRLLPTVKEFMQINS